MIELELLKGRDDFFTIMSLVENAESQNKHGVVDIECLHPVITTFIHIDNEIAERPVGGFAATTSASRSASLSLSKEETAGRLVFHQPWDV
jgi:hypothetical protein